MSGTDPICFFEQTNVLLLNCLKRKIDNFLKLEDVEHKDIFKKYNTLKTNIKKIERGNETKTKELNELLKKLEKQYNKYIDGINYIVDQNDLFIHYIDKVLVDLRQYEEGNIEILVDPDNTITYVRDYQQSLADKYSICDEKIDLIIETINKEKKNCHILFTQIDKLIREIIDTLELGKHDRDEDTLCSVSSYEESSDTKRRYINISCIEDGICSNKTTPIYPVVNDLS